MIPASNYSFIPMWLLVIGISAHDGYLVLVHRPPMVLHELNPVGRLLIHLGGVNVWLLLVAKTIGTVCAASILLVLYWTRPRIGWIACVATTVFQIALLLFLYL